MTKRREKGQSVVEVALLILLVAVVVVGILRIVGVDTADLYCKVALGLGRAPAVCAASDGILFADDFADDDLDNWEIDRGDRWRVEDGELCAGPGQQHRIYASGIEGEDYTISFDATLKSGPGFGVYFRAEDSEVDGYTFQYDEGYGRPGAFIFRKWINGREMRPFRPWSPAPPGYQWYDVKRHFEVSARGNQFTAKIDGAVVATAVDDAVHPVPYYESGGIGLRTWGSEACFDNIVVTTP